MRASGSALQLSCALILLLLADANVHAAPTLTGCFGGANANTESVVKTTLAGVPAIVRIPPHVTRSPIVLWHGFGPPAGEEALMRALPLDDVPSVKVYLGLPLFGARTPPGGTEELVRRQNEDVGLNVFEPVVVGAAAELPRVVSALESHGCLHTGEAIGLFGFSAGGAAALLATADHAVPIGSVVLLNPSTGLSASIDAFEHATGRAYSWSPRSRALAAQTDAVQRAADIAAGSPPPALLLIHGEKDDVTGGTNAVRLEQALEPRYHAANASQRLQRKAMPDLQHNLDAAHAHGALAQLIARWFNRF